MLNPNIIMEYIPTPKVYSFSKFITQLDFHMEFTYCISPVGFLIYASKILEHFFIFVFGY